MDKILEDLDFADDTCLLISNRNNMQKKISNQPTRDNSNCGSQDKHKKDEENKST